MRQETLVVIAQVAQEVGTDDDVALIVNLIAATVGVGQTLPKTSVDRADDVAFLEAAPSEE